ncbi:MAG: hypothetical protein QOF83_3728 [Solirubrobacteraceae bacterium]|jgi:hypothetical protein|nr:hypothetical protein [Solirubrobacteraceae bacterium]
MSRAGALAAPAAAIVLIALAPAAAQATPVSTAQLQSLVTRAAHGDPSALTRLRAVTSIDGTPTGLGQALSVGTPSELRARLLALNGRTAAVSVPPAEARRAARSIVGTPRYGRPTIIDPLLSLLHRIGRWLGSAAATSPGGPSVFWGAAGIVVLLLAALGSWRMLRRLGAAPLAAAPGSSARAEDPALLERRADDAEAHAAFADAVRLRFRAGLLRLGARSAIEYRPSLLTAEVARRLSSPEFNRLADTFERVTYGKATAEPGDAAEARDGWREILSHTGSER